MSGLPSLFWRTGVTAPEQLSAGAPIGEDRPFAYTLLRYPLPPTPHSIAIFEAVVRGFRHASGVFRTTFAGRFAALDAWLLPRLAARFPANLSVQDWAVSDARTSAEWALGLRPAFPALTLTASDLQLSVDEWTVGPGESFVAEPTGELLQYLRPPFVITYQMPLAARWLVNRFLAARGSARWGQLAPALRADPARRRAIPLIHPLAGGLAASDPWFRIESHSVFVRAAPCDVVRTMNIFNLGYFPDHRLREGAAAVWSTLRPGGWWLIGRTDVRPPHPNHATLFARTPSGFMAEAHFGDGAEIEELVLAWRPQ